MCISEVLERAMLFTFYKNCGGISHGEDDVADADNFAHNHHFHMEISTFLDDIPEKPTTLKGRLINPLTPSKEQSHLSFLQEE